MIYKPSQLINAPYYLLCLLLSPILIGIIMFIRRYLITSRNIYILTDDRLIVKSGVFTKQTNDIELYRISDLILIEPFWYRMFKLANINIISSDKSSPNITIIGIKNGSELKELLRNSVEKCRTVKQVTETELIK